MIPRQLSDDEKVKLKNLADMVVGEMTGYFDAETGLADQAALLNAGAKCVD